MLLSNAVEVMVITILVVVQAVSLPQPLLPPPPIITNQMILQKIQQHLSFYLFLKTVRESESGAAIFATTGEYSQVENMIGK